MNAQLVTKAICNAGFCGNPTTVLRINNANSSLTIWLKKENMNKRIGSVQFDRKVLRKPALHIAKPLCAIA